MAKAMEGDACSGMQLLELPQGSAVASRFPSRTLAPFGKHFPNKTSRIHPPHFQTV
jgi:hypothetical protein